MIILRAYFSRWFPYTYHVVLHRSCTYERFTVRNSQFSSSSHCSFPTNIYPECLSQGVSTQAKKLHCEWALSIWYSCYKCMYIQFIKWNTIALCSFNFFVVMYAFHTYSHERARAAHHTHKHTQWSLCAFDCCINWCHLLTQFLLLYVTVDAQSTQWMYLIVNLQLKLHCWKGKKNCIFIFGVA